MTIFPENLGQVFDCKVEISRRKDILQKYCDKLVRKNQNSINHCRQFLSQMPIDKLLRELTDRDFQMNVIKMILLSNAKINFSRKALEEDFKLITWKNFQMSGRKFLSKIEEKLAPKHDSILSFKSPRIELINEHSSGWVDFNEHYIGLTLLKDDVEIVAEIRYSSIRDWFLSDGNHLTLQLIGHEAKVDILVDSHIIFTISKIFSKLGALKLAKKSETNQALPLKSAVKGEIHSNLSKRSKLDQEFERNVSRCLRKVCSVDEYYEASSKIKKKVVAKMKKCFKKILAIHIAKISQGLGNVLHEN